MARLKIVVIALGAFLIAIQFVQPRRTNPAVTPSKSLASHEHVPPEVQSILDRSCGDCHSSRTRWPWYSHVAPLSWVIVDDVNQGRKHMNFQDWEAQENPEEAHEHLANICKEVQDKGMPLFSYRLAHPAARLNPEEIGTLCSWSRSFGSPSDHTGGHAGH